MRKSTLLLLPLAMACGAAESRDYVVIADFLERSPLLACQALTPPEHLAVTVLRTASDSTVLVMDGPGRRLVELDAALRPVWELEAPSAGPGALNAPVAMAPLGDTAVAIAERQGLQLVVWGRSGELIRTVPMGFAPSGLATLPTGELLVTAMPFGDTPRTLLLRYDGTGFHEIEVLPRPYADMFIGALGNTTLAEALPDGAALVIHQFMAPRAFRVGTDGRAERLRVPTPDATMASIDYVPDGPILEEQIERMLVPAAATTVDPVRSEIYLLTRSGRRVDGRTGRAILRLDDRLGLLDSYTLGFVARHLAYLPSEQIVLMVDDEDGFHACDLRRRNSHARAE